MALSGSTSVREARCLIGDAVGARRVQSYLLRYGGSGALAVIYVILCCFQFSRTEALEIQPPPTMTIYLVEGPSIGHVDRHLDLRSQT